MSRCFSDLGRDRSGATAITTALLLVVIMGFAALAIDLGVAYAGRRNAQNAADSAAFSAATAAHAGSANVAGEARAIAREYGLPHGLNGVDVAVHSPAISGAHAGKSQSVEVVITRPTPRFFGGFLGAQPSRLRGRAVALAGANGKACVLALNGSERSAVLVNGSAEIDLVGCSMQVNSSHREGLLANGSARIAADSVNVAGGHSIGGNVNVDRSRVHTGQPQIQDPYASVEPPSFGGCNANEAMLGQPNLSGSPRVFCGLTIHKDVTIQPGVYVIKGDRLIINSRVTVRGEGVTFYLTGGASVIINGNADVRLRAPTSGPFANILFYQDRAASPGNDNIFTGGAEMLLNGALYFPRGHLRFNGGLSNVSGACTQLVADTLTFNGGEDFRTNCSSAAWPGSGGAATALVE